MDDVADAGRHRGGEHPFGRGDVVGGEDRRVEPADLGVELDERLGAGQRVLPAAGAAEVRLDDASRPAGVRASSGVLVGCLSIATMATSNPRAGEARR